MNFMATWRFNPWTYLPSRGICPYKYIPINFQYVENITTSNMPNVALNTVNNRSDPTYNLQNSLIEKNVKNKSDFKLDEIISIQDDKISVLGISINTDDLIILIVIFSLIQNSEEIDYTLLIILGILLFTQD